MRRLPLFPLPVVLFPGAVTPLHIFEPRYRQMVARCLEYDRQFGLIYHDADRMGPFERTEGRMGTVAEIGEFQLLQDGRSLLLAHGTVRFRIEDGIESDTPYLEALVSLVEDPGPPATPARRRTTLGLLERVMARVESDVEDAAALQFSQDEELSFRVAASIRTDPAWQQSVLEGADEDARLDLIDQLFQQVLSTHPLREEP
jgi:Lon protease-like protein